MAPKTHSMPVVTLLTTGAAGLHDATVDRRVKNDTPMRRVDTVVAPRVLDSCSAIRLLWASIHPSASSTTLTF